MKLNDLHDKKSAKELFQECARNIREMVGASERPARGPGLYTEFYKTLRNDIITILNNRPHESSVYWSSFWAHKLQSVDNKTLEELLDMTEKKIREFRRKAVAWNRNRAI